MAEPCFTSATTEICSESIPNVRIRRKLMLLPREWHRARAAEWQTHRNNRNRNKFYYREVLGEMNVDLFNTLGIQMEWISSIRRVVVAGQAYGCWWLRIGVFVWKWAPRVQWRERGNKYTGHCFHKRFVRCEGEHPLIFVSARLTSVARKEERTLVAILRHRKKLNIYSADERECVNHSATSQPNIGKLFCVRVFKRPYCIRSIIGIMWNENSVPASSASLSWSAAQLIFKQLLSFEEQILRSSGSSRAAVSTIAEIALAMAYILCVTHTVHTKGPYK